MKAFDNTHVWIHSLTTCMLVFSSTTEVLAQIPVDPSTQSVLGVGSRHAASQFTFQVPRPAQAISVGRFPSVALSISLHSWAISGKTVRFFRFWLSPHRAPLPLTIAIAIIGSILHCARRAFIVKNSVVLGQIVECRTAIVDTNKVLPALDTRVGMATEGIRGSNPFLLQ
jgi:hypothetical protein